MNYRAWEYATSGDYHRNLDPNWSYTPTYLRKMFVVKDFLLKLSPEMTILDAGCGEGVLVEELRHCGRNVSGLDLNYESEYVSRGSLLNMPYEDASFDVVLLLDVFEHINFSDQPLALREILRVLKPGGSFVAGIPNLAHWNSRFTFLVNGNLDRTDVETNHVGERPMRENAYLINKAGFKIVKTVGITATVPWVYRHVICKGTAKWRWLHDALEPLARLVPSLAMLDIFFCRKPTANVSPSTAVPS